MSLNYTPQIPFDHLSVMLCVPEQPGVYIIYRHDLCLYVGESNDLQRRLVEHLNDPSHDMHAHRPTHVVFQICNDRGPRECDLINRLRPLCTKRRG